MATPIRIKRSAVPGKRPQVSDLQLGELALNTYDGELTTKRDRAGIGADIIRIGSGTTVTNILYVTKDGNDTNTGLKLGDAKRTIGAALTAATTGSVIKVSAGSYLENNPLIIPEQVSIVGDSLREVSVSPQNADKDLFYVANGVYVAEMSYTGTMNPGGAIFAFNPDQIGYFDQSPYIQNGTNFIPNSIGMRVDGSKAIGPTKSMVLDSYTQYNQGGIGISITNEGYAQLVSLFTICDDIAVYCGSGAACDLTNSNSSFGNYGFIADGVSPVKYTGIITGSASIVNDDTFAVDLSTPTLNIVNAIYDNTTGLLTAYTNTEHHFSVGMGITLSGLGFTCNYEPGIGYYPSGEKGYVFEAKTVAPGRYVDSYNLIQANKLEIQDKSLAAIAIGYTAYAPFYFPGDTLTNERSRYYDAYRLIQKNRTEIVDTSWSNTVGVYTGISTTQTKCKRDIGFFVDAVSTDVFTGGNNYAKQFTLQYFNGAGIPISNGLVGVTTQSIYAFQQARNLMKLAIANQLSYKEVGISSGPQVIGSGSTSPVSNISLVACSDVQNNVDTLTSIVTTTIAAGNTSSLPTTNLGSFTTGASKCYRDIGYLVDAISLDVRDYTNQNIRTFIKAYFDANGNPLNNGLVGEVLQSTTAFNGVRDYSKKAITNQLNTKNLTIAADPVTGFNTDPASCANVQTFIDNLVGSVTSSSVGVATSKLSLPAVSMASTVFTCNVGVATQAHYYNSGGTAKTNIIRPFDGQVIYFEDLYYTVSKVIVGSGGTGYTEKPTVTFTDPDTNWGVTAQAVPIVSNGSVTGFEIISSGRGYTSVPKVTIGAPNVGINTATASAVLLQSYYSIKSSTAISAGICTITLNENIPYVVGVGTQVPFYKQSRVLASGHSFEYIGSGTNIAYALPATGGVPIQDNETDVRNGGLVVYTSTDQSGNFRIGDGVVVNQQTGTISGSFYSKSLFSTVTPFILALGGE